MFIITLRFSANKASAGQFMDGHKRWIERGFADGVFLMAGSLQPGLGGVVLADGVTLSEMETRVQQDPFVAEDVVKAEIMEVTPSRADDRLSFLTA